MVRSWSPSTKELNIPTTINYGPVALPRRNFPAGFTFSLCEPGLKILGGKGGGFAIGEAPLYMSVEDAAPQPAAGCMYRDGEEERSIKSDEVTS